MWLTIVLQLQWEIASFPCQNVFKVASFCVRVLHFAHQNIAVDPDRKSVV